jgi:hypothetical protein
MAVLISRASGNFTDSSTWALVDSVSYLDSEAGTTSIGTSNVDSSTWSYSSSPPTVDGVAIKVSSRSSSPGSNTFTVALRDATAGVNVASVTVNVSDLDNAWGWQFFKFSSPVTLETGKNYLVRLVASASSMVTVYRNATSNNHTRMLRTTTQQAPAANDQLHVLHERTGAGSRTDFTVTMNNTDSGTSFGPTVSGGPPHGMTVNQGCTLAFGTAASTDYYLKIKGVIGVALSGTLNIGTSDARMPSSSTATLHFDSVAAGDSGLDSSGTVNIYGAVKNSTRVLLTADASVGATTITVESTDGWAANDSIAIAPTGRTASEYERRTVSSIVSGTQAQLSSGLTYAHSGTSPTQAEVINLTRNVVVRGNSTSLTGYVYSRGAGSRFNASYAEFYYLGANATGKHGVQIDSANSPYVGYCSVHDTGQANNCYGVEITSTAVGATVEYNVVHLSYWQAVIVTGGSDATYVLRGNWCIGITNGYGFSMNNPRGTVTDNRVSGARDGTFGYGFVIEGAVTGTFSGNIAHSNALNGLLVNATQTDPLTISNCKFWRNNQYGVRPTGAVQYERIVLDSVEMFGNSTSNVYLNSYAYDLRLVSCSLNGDTSFSTTNGIGFATDDMRARITLANCSFSQVSGIKTAHTYDIAFHSNAGDRQAVWVYAYNCLFGAANVLSNLANLNRAFGMWSGLYSTKHNQTAGDHRRLLPMGTAQTETTIYKSAPPSERLSPTSASIKLESGGYRRAVSSGQALNVQVWVRKNASYNGAAPRLRVRANPAIGISDDSTLATFSGAADAWVLLSATSPTATGDDGVMEFYVDCDGTAGSVYVDDWSAEVAS